MQGMTGLIAITCTPFIVLPMGMPQLKRLLSYELRKGVHYMALVWGIALACHAPAMHVRRVPSHCVHTKSPVKLSSFPLTV